MEQVNLLDHQKQNQANVSWSTAADELRRGEIGFMPLEVNLAHDRRFSYVNAGSTPGNAVRHWLEAEAQRPAEDCLTQVHSLRKRAQSKAHRYPTK